MWTVAQIIDGVTLAINLEPVPTNGVQFAEAPKVNDVHENDAAADDDDAGGGDGRFQQPYADVFHLL